MPGVTYMNSYAATMPSVSTRGHSAWLKHGDQVAGELHADLFLLIGGERVDDAVDRAGGAGGVQRAEHQVAGFGGGDGGGDRRQVAHFADEHDVGVLAQGAAEGFGEARHVHADLALHDDATSCAGGNTRSGLPS